MTSSDTADYGVIDNPELERFEIRCGDRVADLAR
jgi:hypothetical protein